ncbi:3-keto-disaccharide hydrolase [Gemmata sp.]|uniref:3-keto-disaccharide hydrolase n=1 Tax=Gemmata sp. TaxID=1914242 RepID=UPI003F6E52C0
MRSNAIILIPLAALTLTTLLPARAEPPKPEKFDDTGFVSIFDGKTLDGWKVSAKTGHSGASKNKSGGKWLIEDGAIVGSQDIPANGGIVITEKQYGDFEVTLEMKNDYGPDSGLFLRSTDTGKCYQAMIDYHSNGNLMGVYGEGLGGKPHVRNFDFGKEVTKIVVPSKQGPSDVKCPVAVEDWSKFWKHGEWNELRARIEGNPPKVTTWIKGVKFMEYQDTEKRLGDTGGIALQVHGGGDYTKQFVRYRNIRVKELGNK